VTINCLIFLAVGKLSAFELDKERFEEKKNAPAPWMQAQIDKDFSPFSKVTQKDIKRTMRAVNAQPAGAGSNFVHYHIHSGLVTFETNLGRDDHRILSFIDMIESTHHIVNWPDVDFLASVWDSYDAPHYLAATECPVFTMCKMKNNPYGILIPEVSFQDHRDWAQREVERAVLDSPWEHKIDRALWRGNSTGSYWGKELWDTKGRARLIFLTKERPDLIDAGLTGSYFMDKEVDRYLHQMEAFKDFIWPQDQITHKYLLTLDGNTFASSFRWQLQSNCAIFKQESPYIEWYYGALRPYEHYIPIASDLSDLVEKLTWAKENDEAARAIAESGRAFYLNHLTREDIAVYIYLLLKTYLMLGE